MGGVLKTLKPVKIEEIMNGLELRLVHWMEQDADLEDSNWCAREMKDDYKDDWEMRCKCYRAVYGEISAQRWDHESKWDDDCFEICLRDFRENRSASDGSRWGGNGWCNLRKVQKPWW